MYAVAYHNKGNILRGLKRYEEAIVAYDHAIRLNPNFAVAHYGKGAALRDLGRSKEADSAFEKAYQLGYND